MIYKLEILQAAKRDSWRIYQSLVKKSVSGADRWFQAFLDAARELTDRPERRALAPEAIRIKQPIRQKFFKTPQGRRYRLNYTISGPEVQILRVRAPSERPIEGADLDS